MSESGDETGRAQNGVERIVQSAWMTLSERVAVYLMVPGMGLILFMLADLRHDISDPIGGVVPQVTEIRTIQDKAILPAIRTVEKEVLVIMENLIEHPRFDKEDAERLDDKHERSEARLDREHKDHLKGLDQRLRALESSRSAHEHPSSGPR